MVKKKKKETIDKPSKIKLLLCLVLLLGVSFLIRAWGIKTFTSIVETPRSETKKIPNEVSKNLDPRYIPFYRVPILLYHYVEYVTDKNDTKRQSLNIEPFAF